MEKIIKNEWGTAIVNFDKEEAPLRLPADLIPTDIHDLNEAYIAEIIGLTLSGRVLYDLSGFWRKWDDRRYAKDEIGEIQNLVVSVTRLMFTYLADIDRFSDLGKKLSTYLRSLLDLRKIRNIITLLQGKLPRCDLTAPASSFDKYPYELNVLNGILDLKTGLVRDHDPDAMHTKIVEINYDDDIDPFPKTWWAFLNTVFNNDDELIMFVQKAVGYSLCGSMDEKCFFLCYGTGSNGKSIFFEVLKMLCGDYHLRSEADSFMVNRNKSGSAPTPDLAMLPGKRCVTVTELSSKEINEPLVKGLSAGDEQQVCHKYEKPFTFGPQCKLWLMGNEKPKVHGQDYGFWTRPKMIPFTVQIPVENRIPRDKLLDMLRAELPGILRWAVLGFQSWRDCGLGECAAVDAATKEYRDSQDTIGQFLDQCTMQVPDAECSGSDLYEAYKKWGESNGFHPVASNKFSAALETKKFTKARRINNKRMWSGIGLLNSENTPVTSWQD